MIKNKYNIGAKFSDLITFLSDHSIIIESKIPLNDYIYGIGSLNFAQNNQITFFNNTKYIQSISKTKAKGCFITRNNVKLLPKNCQPIIVDDPYIAYAHSSNFFSINITSNGIINKNTSINSESKLGKNVQIDSFVVLHENTYISDNCIILNNVSIGPNVKIGKKTVIMSNCVISNTTIGNNCNIQSGTIIGEKGFGFTPKSKIEIKHVGNVIIGNNVDIGSNCTIDRAAIDSTIIEDNVRIDNLVQIAHNVSIGKNSIIAAQSGIAGSTSIGKNCILGGQVGVSGHLNIGNNVTIAAKSGVTKNISDNKIIAGFPAIDIKLWKKIIINQYKKIK